MRANANRICRLGLTALVLVLAAAPAPTAPRFGESVAQADPSSPFGPFEQVRQQAHAYCVWYLQGGDARLYLNCLKQSAAAFCSGVRDPITYLWCSGAATTPYPAPGQRVLTAQRYRVEIAGGWRRERDPQSGMILSEQPISPGLGFTLERQPNGLYLGTSYDLSTGQVTKQQWVNDRCEITDAGGRPVMDMACPFFPDKPFLVNILPPPDPTLPPVGQVFIRGRLADDFDEDGVVEIGYFFESGSGGRTFTSGSVEAIGYDPTTGTLKFYYAMAVRESDNPFTTYAIELLVLYRIQSSIQSSP